MKDWILHDNGPCPLPSDTVCRVKHGDIELETWLPAGEWFWESDAADIVSVPMYYMVKA